MFDLRSDGITNVRLKIWWDYECSRRNNSTTRLYRHNR